MTSYKWRLKTMKHFSSFRMTWFNSSLSVPFALCIFQLLSTVSVCTDMEEKYVPAAFAFGDGLMDTGNNNYLLTLLKSNFPPYGRDFEQGKATGRFSNGRVLSDFLEALGLKKNMPAYRDPNLREQDLVTGVSFASVGGGFDDLTSKILAVTSMKDQLKMFKEYVGRLKGLVGDERTNIILNNSVYVVAAGTGDMITYFDSPFKRSNYDAESYTDFLLLSATSFIKKLYKLGARKIVVGNIPVGGCAPLQRTLRGGLARECAGDYNQAALLLNTKLAPKLEFLDVLLPGSKLVYMDLYGIFLDVIMNATRYGLKVVDRGCCGSGLIEFAVLCNSFSFLCENRTEYLFWDGLHPTEAGYRIISTQIVENYIMHLL